MSSAFDRQVGGDHYKGHSPQPVEVAMSWGLKFPEGSVLKYLFRWHVKGNIEDLKKLHHWVEMILERASDPVRPDPASHTQDGPEL